MRHLTKRLSRPLLQSQSKMGVGYNTRSYSDASKKGPMDFFNIKDLLGDVDSPLEGLDIMFGGTGRGALESFKESKPNSLVQLNSMVQASVGRDKDAKKINRLKLLVDGVGYVDPESGLMHGKQESHSKFELFKALGVGDSTGGMDSNFESVMELMQTIGPFVDPQTLINVLGYSRGSISGAKTLQKLGREYPENSVSGQLYDPVAGALLQSPYDVSASNTMVQYSLGNPLPGFWSTPILGASSLAFLQGGHSTATRENMGRKGDLGALSPGVFFENSGELNSVDPEAMMQILMNMHEYEYGSYMEHPTNSSRFTEMMIALKHMKPVSKSSDKDDPDKINRS